jgi:hypothetical protein
MNEAAHAGLDGERQEIARALDVHFAEVTLGRFRFVLSGGEMNDRIVTGKRGAQTRRVIERGFDDGEAGACEQVAAEFSVSLFIGLTTVTSWPARRAYCASCEPMKPVPPVRKIFMIA